MGCHGSVSRANKCRQSPEAKKPGGGVNENGCTTGADELIKHGSQSRGTRLGARPS